MLIKTRDLDSLNISLFRRNEQCLPFTIEYREGKGNVIVAARDIKPFETILIDRPAIVGPFDDTLPECLECFSEVSVEGYKVIYRELPMVLSLATVCSAASAGCRCAGPSARTAPCTPPSAPCSRAPSRAWR